MIAEMDEDDDEDKEVADSIKDVEEAKVDQSTQEDETEPAKVQEVVDVVTTAKLITEVVTAARETVTAASAIITTTEAQVPAATTATLTADPVRVTAAPSRRRKGVTKEQIEKDENRALQTINKTPAERAAKRRKLNEEVEDLKIHLQIVPNEDDDVYTKATPLARKDLEALGSLVKERFSTAKHKNFSIDFLLTTLRAMFEKPDAHA
nr:hypothetical protein [Tanacetum cinerariifolium]